MITNDANRIVVTGIGVISAIGQNAEEFFSHAREGRVAIRPVRGFDVSRMNAGLGGEIDDFDVLRFFPKHPTYRKLGRAKQMALAAAKQCIEDAKFNVAQEPFHVGVAVGFTQGESQTLEHCTDKIEAGGLTEDECADFGDFAPFTIPYAIARHFSAWGPSLAIGNACAAGNFAIGQALDYLRSGEAVAMIAGGADAFSRYGYAGFARLGTIAPDVPRPFSMGRRGMVPGEGAAMLFLERLDSARRRGTRVYAEVVGYGESCDAHHITQPDTGGIARAIRAALTDSTYAPEHISYVSVHGTGTLASDLAESTALRDVFGAAIPPLSSVKSMIAHAMGAASAIECVAAILSIKHQFLLPTMNYLGPDEECKVDCVPNCGRPAIVDLVLKTASAFGGNNAAVLFKRFNEEV